MAGRMKVSKLRVWIEGIAGGLVSVAMALGGQGGVEAATCRVPISQVEIQDKNTGEFRELRIEDFENDRPEEHGPFPRTIQVNMSAMTNAATTVNLAWHPGERQAWSPWTRS